LTGVKEIMQRLDIISIERHGDEIHYTIWGFPPDTRSGYFSDHDGTIDFPFSKSDRFEHIQGNWYIYSDA
jgi:hypothetical protein